VKKIKYKEVIMEIVDIFLLSVALIFGIFNLFKLLNVKENQKIALNSKYYFKEVVFWSFMIFIIIK